MPPSKGLRRANHREFLSRAPVSNTAGDPPFSSLLAASLSKPLRSLLFCDPAFAVAARHRQLSPHSLINVGPLF
jgi:hypothetical protein